MELTVSIIAAELKARKARAKLDYTETAYSMSRNHTPQQQAAVTRAERALGKAIREAYPNATMQESIEIYTKLQELE